MPPRPVAFSLTFRYGSTLEFQQPNQLRQTASRGHAHRTTPNRLTSTTHDTLGRPLESPHCSGWAVGMRDADYIVSPNPLTGHGSASGQLRQADLRPLLDQSQDAVHRWVQ